MAINLQKGSRINLKKSENDLSTVTIGLGWDVLEKSTGILGKLFGGGQPQEEYDLDVIAVLLGADGKVQNLGQDLQGDVIFFNNMRHSSGCVWLTGDNRTGAGDGDDEQIICRLSSLPLTYRRIVFIVQIYQGLERKQHFGCVANAFIRAVDAAGREMVRYEISNTAEYQNKCSMVFAELVRQDQDWSFSAIGRPYAGDSFVEILKQYV